MKEFLPHLTTDQGQSLHVVGAVITQTAIPNPIDDAPEGWEKSTVQFMRSSDFRALFKSYTTPLKFVLEGAYILRYYFYTFGMEAILYFIWLKLDMRFGSAMDYKSWYKGEPDLSTFRDTDEGVEVIINESGFFKDLTSNKAIVYEYKLNDDPRRVSVEISGMPIANTATYVVADAFEYVDEPMFTPIVVMVESEGTNFIIDFNSQDYDASMTDIGDYVNDSLNYLFKNKSAQVQTVRMTGTVFVRCTYLNTTAPLARLFLRQSGAGVLPDFMTHSFFEGEVVARTIDQTFVLQPGEKVFLFGMMSATNISEFRIDFLENSKIQLDFKSIKPVTVHPALRAVDLGRNLCESMSDGLSTMESNLLDADQNLLITSGDAIRGITDAVIKTRWNDYHKSIDAVRCVSFGIVNQNGRLEVRRFAFQQSQIANLGSSSNMELTSANEYVYDSIENGYPAEDIEDVNGRYSFCNTCIYKLPGRRIKNTYDIKSVYLADPYVIELTRINLENKRTTDANTDNKIFFLDAEKVYADITNDLVFDNNPDFNFGFMVITGRVGLGLVPGVQFTIDAGPNAGSWTIGSVFETAGSTYVLLTALVVFDVVGPSPAATIIFNHYRMRRLPYTDIQGFPDGVGALVYNMELSPKSILKPHYEWIYSACEFMDGKSIVFQSTDKNDKVSRTLAGVVTREREDITINAATLGTKIYRPYYLSAECETPVGLMEVIDTGALGYFSLDTYRGYPIEIKTNEATMETQQYKLLCTGDTDLLNRITQN